MLFVIDTLHLEITHYLHESSRQAEQDAALRQERPEQEDQKGRQGRPIAIRRGQVYPEGPTGHVSRPVRMAYARRAIKGSCSDTWFACRDECRIIS